MKRLVIIMLILLGFFGCSRNQLALSGYNGKGFYFTSEHGQLYEYSGTINKITNERLNSVNYLQTNNLHTSTKSSVNILEIDGNIIFRHEPKKKIVSSVLNKEKTKFMYVTTAGQFYEYNTETNVTNKLALKVYPLPRQMIWNEEDNSIFYTDKSSIFKIDLNNFKISLLTKLFFPIQSIAYNSNTNDIYFSTSTDGKIYKIHEYSSTIFLIHKVISARGAALSIDSTNQHLFFSKSNGRDVQIKSLNFNTKEINHVLTIFQMNHIDQLLIKD